MPTVVAEHAVIGQGWVASPLRGRCAYFNKVSVLDETRCRRDPMSDPERRKRGTRALLAGGSRASKRSSPASKATC
jgi:hypothetical protein